MAIAIINNLYPPIMDTYMPAFNREKKCKVYFSLSSFNDREDINNYAQVQIRYQQSNVVATKNELYPAGIMILPILYDEIKKQYYIEFAKRDMKNDKFELNVYYKVQIRLMTKDIEILIKDGIVTQPSYSWLNNEKNLINFSEWSKITLIRGIATPFFSFNSFEVANENNNKDIIIINNRSITDLVGKMNFTNLEYGEEEQDRLKSYRIYLYNKNDLSNLLYDSGIQYPDSINVINQAVEFLFQDESYYRFIINIETLAGYTDILILDFFVSNQYDDEDRINDECKIKCELDKEDGRIKIVLTNLDKIITSTFDGDLIFRRSSQDSNFTYWEDILRVDNSLLRKIENTKTHFFTWYDYTIESGKMYQYAVQKIIYNNNRESHRGLLKMAESYYIQVDLEDSFFTTYNNQIKIKFNPQVTNFSKTVAENKIETVGSKYPFFFRNANIGYKTFSVSGTIHSLTDENYIFLNKNNFLMVDTIKNDEVDSVFYHDSKEQNIKNEEKEDLNRKKIYGKYYDNLALSNGLINDYDDYNYEKIFRDLIIEFLTDGKPKLFRSATEGNILVRLMNVSFTPNQTVGRLFYNFSATAYEIDDFNLSNCIKYNIHNLNYNNEYYDNINYIDNDINYIGELILNSDDNSDILEVIKNKSNFSKKIDNNIYLYSLKEIDWIYFSFPTTKPYDEQGVDESSLLYHGYNNELSFEKNESDSFYIGHIININNTDIVIPQYKNYYITKEDMENAHFSNITIPEDKNNKKNIKILYKASLNRIKIENNDISRIKKRYLKVGVGQIWGGIESGVEIISKIKSLYNYKTDKEAFNITKIKKIYLEGNPGACFKRVRKDGEIETYVLNSTGQLDLSYGEESLDNFTFCGFEMYKAKNPVQMHEQEYFIPNLKEFSSIKDVSFPKNNYVYNISGQYKIYYLGHWCDFEELNENTGIAKYKDEVIIYYLYNLQKGEK